MDLEKFILAQERFHQKALEEIKNGHKQTHWMWFIFPQIRGLGESTMSGYYAIDDFESAKEYLSNEYLRNNYLELCKALLDLNTNNAIEIFGGIDALKLHSSLTLFHLVDNNLEVLKKLLNKFFNGKLDEKTIEILSKR